jgi:hypothetical protein
MQCKPSLLYVTLTWPDAADVLVCSMSGRRSLMKQVGPVYLLLLYLLHVHYASMYMHPGT